MKVLGVIPARWQSSRFPGKPLIDLNGKPMIQHVYEGAQKSVYITELVVATDDQRIVDVVNQFGGQVQLTSINHKSGTDRCAEVAMHSDADVVINIQGDEPLVDARQLDQLLESFKSKETQIATLCTVLKNEAELTNPNRIKVVSNHRNEALYFSRSPIPNAYHSGISSTKEDFLRHIGLYAYKRETLIELTKLTPTRLEQIESLEQLRWMYYGYPIKLVHTDIETPNIDVPEDVVEVLKLLELRR